MDPLLLRTQPEERREPLFVCTLSYGFFSCPDLGGGQPGGRSLTHFLPSDHGAN